MGRRGHTSGISDRWPNVPVVVLGDFGLAIHTDAEGMPNPEAIVGNGTLNYMAPEQILYPGGPTHRLGSPADVYAIGKVVLCLMALWDRDQVVGSGYDKDHRGRIPIPESLYDEYPQDLIALVKRCLEPTPKNRITANELLVEITRIVQEYPKDFDSLPMKFCGLSNERVVITQPDVYAIFAR